MIDFSTYLKSRCIRVESFLAGLLPACELLTPHFEAMRYSLLAGGKRIRPILCMAAAESIGVSDVAKLLPVAAAIECIHTYSLIHDDLPAMDNDDLRRGKPTNHKVFGEAAAILAGDGLLTLAFELLSNGEVELGINAVERLRIINIVSTAAGPKGMVGGQALDMASEGKNIDMETLCAIHSFKTGMLITASVQAGAILGGANEFQFAALSEYGKHIGLTFQMVDDLLNVLGSPEELGKAAGSDAERNKATYPSLLGLERTRELVDETAALAKAALADFDVKADPLRDLADYILTRKR